MMFRKLCCLTLFACISLVGSSAMLRSSSQPKPALQCEGGSPVPPWPQTLLSETTLRAEGGSPVPPWPTGNLAV
jgi:hypothetical protein